jgi:hypothetical protein
VQSVGELQSEACRRVLRLPEHLGCDIAAAELRVASDGAWLDPDDILFAVVAPDEVPSPLFRFRCRFQAL